MLDKKHSPLPLHGIKQICCEDSWELWKKTNRITKQESSTEACMCMTKLTCKKFVYAPVTSVVFIFYKFHVEICGKKQY